MKHYKVSSYRDDIENFEEVVRITDFDNFFNVYEDNKLGRLAFNLNATMYFNVNADALPSIQLQHAAFWPQISYMLYNTPRLAWLLMKLNNVNADKMFDKVATGTKVKYFNTETMQTIVETLN